MVSALGIYATIIAYTRLASARSVSSMSTFDLAVTVALGAILGRVALTHVSLLGGIVGLGTLFVAETLVRRLRNRTEKGRELIDNPPVLLAADGELYEDRMRREGLSRVDISAELRCNGLGSVRDVGAMVLERNGSVSVIARDQRVDGEVLDDVR